MDLDLEKKVGVEEEPTQKTKKQQWEENIRNKYPDNDFSDEDSLYEMSMQGYDNEHEYRKKVDKENSELISLLTDNPDVAMFIGSLVSGDSLYKSMAYLKDILPLNEGDVGWDDYNNQVASIKEKEALAKEAASKYEENLEASAEAIKTFAQNNGMSDEEAVEFIKGITEQITNKLFAGTIDEDFLQMFYDAKNYETDVESAKEAGRIAGRNETIKAKRSKRKSDGLPALNSSTSAVGAEKEKNATLSSLENMLGRRDPYFMKK